MRCVAFGVALLVVMLVAADGAFARAVAGNRSGIAAGRQPRLRAGNGSRLRARSRPRRQVRRQPRRSNGSRRSRHVPSTHPRAGQQPGNQAVQQGGPSAGTSVDADGDLAAALFACSPDVAALLADFYDAGGLDSLPEPDDLLDTIAQPGGGDDVALFAIQHSQELADPDAFQAYLKNPRDYVRGQKNLADGAAEVRNSRENQAGTVSRKDLMKAGAAVLAIPLLCVIVWQYRRPLANWLKWTKRPAEPIDAACVGDEQPPKKLTFRHVK